MEACSDEEKLSLLSVQKAKQLHCSSSGSSFSRRRKSDAKAVVMVVLATALSFLAFSQLLDAFSGHNDFLHGKNHRVPFKGSEGIVNHPHRFSSMNFSASRKLLVKPERMGDACSLADIAIFQGETGPLPDGIPSFSVQIINLCVSGCPISDIHVTCGWFASAKLINPKLFKRVKYNDCIVNDRLPLKGGDSIVFEYANSFQYPLEISSANACCW